MTHQEMVDDILDNFDFEKVHSVMKHLDWKWNGGQAAHVPEIRELRKMARMLLKNVLARDPPVETSCGGFWASWGGEDVLRLMFSVDEWTAGEGGEDGEESE